MSVRSVTVYLGFLKNPSSGTPRALSPFMWELDLGNCHRFAGTEQINAFELAVIQDPVWGLLFSTFLISQNRAAADIWAGIFRGFQKAVLDSAHWQSLFRVLEVDELLAIYHREITDILVYGIDKESGRIPEDLLPISLQLSKRLWTTTLSQPQEDNQETCDWVSDAINHSSGRLSEFWIKLVSRQNEDKETKNLTPELKAVIQNAIAGQSYEKQLARVIIAGQVFYFFSLDPEWTNHHIIPGFDFAQNPLMAALSFHGYLQWGRWNEELLKKIRPYLIDGLLHLDILGHAKEKLIEYVAAVFLYSDVSPHSDQFLSKILSTANETDRKIFIGKLSWLFRNTKDNMKGKLWEFWLKQFFDDVVHGRPVRISDVEYCHLIEMTLNMDVAFPDALRTLVKRPVPSVITNLFLLHDLKDKPIVDSYPGDFLKFLLYILPSFQNAPIDLKEFENLTEKIILLTMHERPHKARLLELCDHLARLGVSRWSTFKSMIEAATQEEPATV